MRSCEPWPFLPFRASVPLERTVIFVSGSRHIEPDGRQCPPWVARHVQLRRADSFQRSAGPRSPAHIAKLETLQAAYAEARRNGGAAGVDGLTFEQIEGTGRDEFLAELVVSLRSRTYRPMPLRRKEIPKEGGKVRVISIPTIRDRVAQGAVRLILEPIFEADFSDSSYGARPGRSAHQALEVVRSGLRQHKNRVVDVDLSRFFDMIRHDRMLAKLARRVRDDEVLALLKQFLVRTGERGIPQGSPLTPPTQLQTSSGGAASAGGASALGA